jgi:hypothetical protein
MGKVVEAVVEVTGRSTHVSLSKATATLCSPKPRNPPTRAQNSSARSGKRCCKKKRHSKGRSVSRMSTAAYLIQPALSNVSGIWISAYL